MFFHVANVASIVFHVTFEVFVPRPNPVEARFYLV